MPATRAQLLAIIQGSERCSAEQAAAQLKRFVKAGLLPGGDQVHQSGEAGSTSRYPDGADQFLCALLEHREQERRDDELVMSLFWRDEPVWMEAVRDRLGTLAAEAIEGVKRELAAHGGNQVTAAERATEQAHGQRLNGSKIRPKPQAAKRADVAALRHDAGSALDFLSAFVAIMQIGRGVRPLWQPEVSALGQAPTIEEGKERDLAAIFASTIGFPGMGSAVVAAVDSLLAAGNIEAILRSGANDATEAELQHARDLTRSLIDSGGVCGEAWATATRWRPRYGLSLVRALRGGPRAHYWRMRALLIAGTAGVLRSLPAEASSYLQGIAVALDAQAPLALAWLDTYNRADRATRAKMRRAIRDGLRADSRTAALLGPPRNRRRS